VRLRAGTARVRRRADAHLRERRRLGGRRRRRLSRRRASGRDDLLRRRSLQRQLLNDVQRLRDELRFGARDDLLRPDEHGQLQAADGDLQLSDRVRSVSAG
jgi:hypothetical protein